MDERDLAKASLLKALDLYKFTQLPYKSDDMCAENLEVEDFNELIAYCHRRRVSFIVKTIDVLSIHAWFISLN